MSKTSLLIFLFFYIILLSLIPISFQQINPEEFKSDDILFPENDKLNDYYYSLIDAKVLTSEEITLYLKKQGIHLSRDESGPKYTDYNAWSKMEAVSDFKEIYSNAKYNPSSNQIEYKFPVDKIENAGYTLYHNAWIINKETVTTTLKVKLKYTDNSLEEIYSNNLGERNLFQTEITCESNIENSVVTYINKLTVKKPEAPAAWPAGKVYDAVVSIYLKLLFTHTMKF